MATTEINFGGSKFYFEHSLEGWRPQRWTDRHPIEDILRRVTYRPGWTFRVLEGRTLLIDARVIDTDDHSRNILVTFTVGLPDPRLMAATIDWQRWLFEQLREVEDHERAEFFKVNGQKVYDPHK